MITEAKQIVKLWENKVGTQPNMNDENHIMHLSILLVEQGWDINQRSELFSMLNEDESWWTKMSPDQQADYIKKHPKSQKAQDAKEKEKEDKPKREVGTMSDKDDELSDGDIKQKGLEIGYKETGDFKPAPGNAGSMLAEIMTGEVGSFLENNPDCVMLSIHYTFSCSIENLHDVFFCTV